MLVQRNIISDSPSYSFSKFTIDDAQGVFSAGNELDLYPSILGINNIALS